MEQEKLNFSILYFYYIPFTYYSYVVFLLVDLLATNIRSDC